MSTHTAMPRRVVMTTQVRRRKNLKVFLALFGIDLLLNAAVVFLAFGWGAGNWQLERAEREMGALFTTLGWPGVGAMAGSTLVLAAIIYAIVNRAQHPVVHAITIIGMVVAGVVIYALVDNGILNGAVLFIALFLTLLAVETLAAKWISKHWH